MAHATPGDLEGSVEAGRSVRLRVQQRAVRPPYARAASALKLGESPIRAAVTGDAEGAVGASVHVMAATASASTPSAR